MLPSLLGRGFALGVSPFPFPFKRLPRRLNATLYSEWLEKGEGMSTGN